MRRDIRSFFPTEIGSAEPGYDQEKIGRQLDAFSEAHGLKSLRDRLRIGLNEVAILAFDRTNTLVKGIVEKMKEDVQEQDNLYRGLVDLCVAMQESGPWEFAHELANPQSPEIQAWFILAGAETIGYEREMDLNPQEFAQDIRRIEENLIRAAENPEMFFHEAREHLLQKSESAIRYREDDPDHKVPIGEGFGSLLPMAMRGHEAGVIQDAEGWVFVGARGEIEDGLLMSVGLKKEMGPDDRDPKRMVTYFVNDRGQRVLKKLHPGFLVVLSRSLDLASSIVRGLHDDQETLELAEHALAHTRVVQTTEKERGQLSAEVRMPEGFMRHERRAVDEAESTTTALSRPRTEFYDDFLYVRALYVYADALRQLEERRAKDGKPVTEHDRERLSGKIWEKMRQKTDELRYVNEIIGSRLDAIPSHVTSVIDMAGGAGDLGLAVANEFLSTGRDVNRVEVVDPQEGVAEFMETIIEYLPFRERMEEVAVHNTGYLQDAHITSESIVVAKHACGTLTDAVIEQWRDSKSPMLVAMTCCQGKAQGEPARYGLSQQDWDRFCRESDWTNTTVPDQPGKARERALERLALGNRAMKTLDMARVNYLRRHGFQAELVTTDKFPKGDVIVARRLPDNFMETLARIEALEKADPRKFDALMMALDLCATGRSQTWMASSLGADWTPADCAELTSRFVAPALGSGEPPSEQADQLLPKDAGKDRGGDKELLKTVFADVKGRIDLYVKDRGTTFGRTIEARQLGPIIEAIRNRVFRDPDAPVEDIRRGVDELMEQHFTDVEPTISL